MREIPHNSKKHSGAVILVDDDVYDEVMAAGSWRPHRGGHGSMYAVRDVLKDGRHTTQRLHNFLAKLYGLPKSPDHKNRNGLDNRRENLRPATGAQQMGNQGVRSNNTSGYKGVTWENGKWRARGKGYGRTVSLGCFDRLEDAGRAYNKWAIEYFGIAFTVLNCANGVPL